MPSKLQTLNVEIFELISTLLEPADLRCLRLICHDLNIKALHHFNLAHFNKVQTDLSRESLRRLHSISESENLAPYVQSLYIEYPEDCKYGRGFHWHRHQGCLATNQANEGARLLRDILLHKLLKCRSFHIKIYDEYQPRVETDYLIPSDAVGLLLSIIAEANTDFELRSFTITCEHGSAGRLSTPQLQMPLCQLTSFKAAWSHVEKLDLGFTMTADQYDWVLSLISPASQLRVLSLGLHGAEDGFMERLGTLFSLSKLQTLSFRSAFMRVESTLALLMQNRETLRSLSFHSSTIRHEDTWATLLQRIKNQFPRLEELSFYLSREDRSQSPGGVFAKLIEYPRVPGSEEYAPGTLTVKWDCRQIPSVKEPVRLRYFGRLRSVIGVEYNGTGVDLVLAALAHAYAEEPV